MKRVISLVLTIVVVFVLVACGQQAAPAPASTPAPATESKLEDKVVIGDWGGTWGEMSKEYIFADFKANNPNCEIVSDFPGSSAKTLAKMEAQKDNPQLDVALLTEVMALKAVSAGLIEPFDFSKIPESSELVDIAKLDGVGPAILLGETGIAYNPKVVKEAPTSWLDLAKPEFKGKVALPSFGSASQLQFLSMIAKINGGDEDNTDKAFEFLNTMKDNVKLVYAGDPDVYAAFEREEITAAVWYGGPATAAKKDGLSVEYVRPKEGVPATRSFICVVKGAPHPNAAYELVRYYISKHGQEGVMNVVGYGPTNKNVVIPDDKKLYMPSVDTIASLVNFNWTKIAANTNAWSEKWDKTLGK